MDAHCTLHTAHLRSDSATLCHAGTPLGAFAWDRGRIAAMGWSDAQQLLVLEETGEVATLNPKP